MKRIPGIAIVAIALTFSATALAQDVSESMDHADHMDHTDADQSMDTDHMDHTGADQSMDTDAMDHSEHMAPSDQKDDSGAMDHSQHSMDSGEMDHSRDMDHSGNTMTQDQADQTGSAAPMQAGTESGELRDPHAYAEGADFGPLGRPHLHDEKHFGAVLIDRLEAVESKDNSWFAFSGQAWYGSTYDRANLKLELEADSGTVEHSRTELLWSHAVASFWDTQLGVRFDSGETPDRTWAAFGIQGLAPYWFHVDATLYAGEHGDTAARFEADYELLFTQRLILQPRLEANLYGQNDDETETGSGLSDLTIGLRLRYEITRQFAPYVGIQWAGLYGDTADYARNDNLPTEETSWVIGVHMWF